jgi:hypothetical protein
MNVCVVSIETRRFFDECQASYLPEMYKVFGVFSTQEKAENAVFSYFMDRYSGQYEIYDECHDADGNYIGSDIVFIRKDKMFGGHALYGIEFHHKDIDG